MGNAEGYETIKGHAFTDQDLVRLAQNGNSDAFGELVLRYQNMIYRLARRMTETREDAEDVLQEAFITAFKSITGFRAESRFSTWLYRITVNAALTKKRRTKMTFEYLDEPVTTDNGEVTRDIVAEKHDPLSELIVRESQEILDRAITALSPINRAVFVLRHIEGLSTEETRTLLNMSSTAVKSRLHRTRQILQQNLVRLAREEAQAVCAA